ncbi:hypothetical protein K474DRAFT_1616965 [Panus rudis PR-1116 ss-1]|nr:hypothetical protein K474DRAFT_1616965 [Panus rudis PR-1116 ss-1]
MPSLYTKGKRRITALRWPRDPDGPTLPRPPLEGDRPPNGILWGHDTSEFCFIRRLKGVEGLITCWSRSQIRDLGENYTQELQEAFFDEPDFCPKPRRRRPWPVLKLPRKQAAKCDPPLGLIDEGSDHEDDWEALLVDDPFDEQEVTRDDTSKITGTITTYLPPSVKEDGWADDIFQIFTYNDFARTRILVWMRPSGSTITKSTFPYRGGTRTLEVIPLSYEPEEKEDVGHLDLYSVDGIPTLAEKIPRQYFPDTLLVHDQFNLSSGREPTSGERKSPIAIENHKEPIVYKRVYPAPTSSDGNNTASLYLSPKNLLGTGHHSLVYGSPLTLPSPLTTYRSAHPASSARQGTVKVAAKLAVPRESARVMLKHEARIYDSFPEYMSEEYCGYHIVSPWVKSPTPSTPVVPKFYGYYVPVEKERKAPTGEESSSKEDGDDAMDVDEESDAWKRPSPILLIEDCGVPIDPKKLDVDERSEIYSFLIRLHVEDYLHNSFYLRNILMQPGPLTRQPSHRSLSTPSFRLIDFGRTETLKSHLEYKRWKKRQQMEGDGGNGKGADEEKKDDGKTEEERAKEEEKGWSIDFDLAIRHEWHKAREELGFSLVDNI